MKSIGNGIPRIYGPEDDRTHTPGPQELWQESVVVLWWDPVQSIGGVYRIGHETNIQPAMVCSWNNTFSPEGIYKRNTYLSLREEDRSATRMGSGDGTLRYDFDGTGHWTLDDEDIHAELEVLDFHPPFDGWPKSGQVSEFSPHHIDIACRVKGQLRVKGRTYEVDALGFRDHGWGLRDWKKLLSHRWCVGAFGSDLSFCGLTFHSPDDVFVRFGWIVRGDTIIFADKIDIVAHLEYDGITTRGGTMQMVLPGGEVLDFVFEAFAPSSVAFHMGIVNCDTLSKVTCADRVGIGCFETTNNALHGSRRPNKVVRGILHNGWHEPIAGDL